MAAASEGGPGAGGVALGERLRGARRRRFVGRRGELELFAAALQEEESPFAVLFVHGPGGVGKTALLRVFADAAAEAGIEAARIDLRGIEPTPPAFLAALAAALGTDETRALEVLRDGGRRALLLDTYESAVALDEWLRERFLPLVGSGVVVVVAGRIPPPTGWRADPGWRELMRSISLRNLSPGEARELLGAERVPEGLHDRAVELTHGHPLALSLVLDLVAQRSAGDSNAPSLDLFDSPDAVRALLERFAQEAPTTRHRRALEACAHARLTTEDLLSAALGGEEEAELFEWLRTLSFIEEGRDGIFPHDLARNVIEADLSWRTPERHAELHRRIRSHVLTRIRRDGARHADVADMVFMHRHSPQFAPFMDWSALGSAYADRLRPDDADELVAITERHQGTDSAKLVEHWLEHQPQAFFVFRQPPIEVQGFAALLALHEASEDEIAADPGARAMLNYVLRHGAPRPGEEVYAARFLLDREAHQAPSPALSLIPIVHLQHIFGRGRDSWELIGPWIEPDWVEPMMSHIDFHRAPEADYEVGGRRYGVFAHDWRRLGVEEWLDLTGDRELESEAVATAPQAPAEALALSQDEFDEAVAGALRDLHRPEALAANPLMRSRAVADRGREQPTPETLRDLLADAISALRVDPRDEKLYRALARTYVRPAGTQELAAEALGLPFSTYRRHRSRGVERVVEWLWQRELYGPGA